jgi:hypothetical protein
VLAALDERIAVRYSIAGMSAPDTANYIRHHCKIAGRADTVFSDDAIGLIHNASRGYRRAVNNLALHALTAAFAAEHAIVDERSPVSRSTKTPRTKPDSRQPDEHTISTPFTAPLTTRRGAVLITQSSSTPIAPSSSSRVTRNPSGRPATQ